MYVRTPPDKQGNPFHIHLIAAKGKITPKKTPTAKANPNTIPKFELAGVVVAAHQLTYISQLLVCFHHISSHFIYKSNGIQVPGMIICIEMFID